MIGRYNIFLAGRATVYSNWSKDLTSLPVHRLYYVHNGEARINTARDSILMREKHIYLFPAFSVTSSYCPDYLDHSYVNFSTTNDRDRSLWDIDSAHMELQPEEDESLIQQMFDTISINKNKGDLAASMRVRGYMDILLSPFFESFGDNSNGPLQKTVQFMEDHIQDKLTLSDLASKAGYVPGYFTERFKTHYGESPIRFLNRRRIEQSQELLMSTDLPIKEICSLVGIDDARYFNRLFKRATGCSPGQYRARILKTLH